MQHIFARKGGMGPDGVYRDPAAYVPKFSFLIAEPAMRALQLLIVSFCLLTAVCLYKDAVVAHVAPALSSVHPAFYAKIGYFSAAWTSNPHYAAAIHLATGVVCAALLLYLWYRTLRCIAQGYRLPAKLRKASDPPSWMKGKVAVVTGGNAGIGRATTEQLVRWGVHVLIGCRRVDEASKFADSFLGQKSKSKRKTGAPTSGTRSRSSSRTRAPASKAGASGLGSIRVHYLDLMDLASVQAFAEWAVAESGGKVDILVNNAGMLSTEYLSVDPKTGFEKHFVTNHLGPFLLTQLLLPAVKQAKGRIINLSSIAHVTHGPKLRALDYAVSSEAANAIALKLKRPLEELQGEPLTAQNYNSRQVYGDTKLFNIWFTKALQRRLAAENDNSVAAYAAHPGMVNTDLMLHYTQGTASWLTSVLTAAHRMVAPLIFKTTERGAATQLMLCVTDKQQLKPGAFYKDGTDSWVAPMALDEQKQEELWNISMLMCQPYISTRASAPATTEVHRGRARGRAA